MNHVALDWPWPDNSNFNYQVIKALWLQPWKHRLLSPAFDLKYTDGVGVADHLVHQWIILWYICECQVESVVQFCKVECLSDTGQHSQCQHIDLQKSKRIDVILIPFNVGAVLHAGIEDRTKIRELAIRDYKSTCVLAKLSRKADKLVGELQHFHQAVVIWIQSLFENSLAVKTFIIKIPYQC